MSVLVVGCGYLGSRAARLWADDGRQTYCITRNQHRADTFRQSGFSPIVADITQPDSLADLPSVQTVLFAVGFDRSRYDDIRKVYVDGLQNVLNRLPASVSQFIYISSTGVFGNNDGDWVDEGSSPNPQRPGGKACLEAESIISETLGQRATILRLAGIYGPGRIPRIEAIRNQDWQSLGQSGHINLIHVDDSAAIVIDVARQNLLGDMFLVSDGKPPQRKDFYEFIAGETATGPIDWSVSAKPDVSRRASADKRISNQKLLKALKYEFIYPDYQAGLRHSIAESD